MPYSYLFFDDYSEGAHPRLLQAIIDSNMQQERGYGDDRLCLEAARRIRERIGNENVDVHFVCGGTQANLVSIASLLRPYESVVAVESAHIALHEAGAIEATGHKIHAVAGRGGKLAADSLRAVLEAHTDEHMVRPKLAFISQATELGTVYSSAELQELADFMHAQKGYLYVDGARLGVALTSEKADLDLPELARAADIFSIGGTKNGALLGEAIVIANPALKEGFRHHMKQRGALLAKARVLGAQFAELFREDLYFELARRANALARKLAAVIQQCGYAFYVPPATNQLFPILPDDAVTQLQQKYGFYVWNKGESSDRVIRLVTSWATPEAAVEQFLADLKSL